MVNEPKSVRRPLSGNPPLAEDEALAKEFESAIAVVVDVMNRGEAQGLIMSYQGITKKANMKYSVDNVSVVKRIV